MNQPSFKAMMENYSTADLVKKINSGKFDSEFVKFSDEWSKLNPELNNEIQENNIIQGDHNNHKDINKNGNKINGEEIRFGTH